MKHTLTLQNVIIFFSEQVQYIVITIIINVLIPFGKGTCKNRSFAFSLLSWPVRKPCISRVKES